MRQRCKGIGDDAGREDFREDAWSLFAGTVEHVMESS
jgi:hypothetical protein